LISIIILSGKNQVLTNVDSCPVSHEVIIEKSRGLGFARDLGAQKSKGDLIVMFDDDLKLNPKIWDFILNLKGGEFALATKYHRVSSQVFAVHISDYAAVGGFDPEIRYVFEDGDFYLRALRMGLTCKIIPTKYYAHIPHRLREQNRFLGIKYNWEFTKFIVKYKRECIQSPVGQKPENLITHDFFNYFIRPFDYRITPFQVVTKIIGLIYWVLHGVD